MTGYKYFMCGGVKWKSMMFTASSVRTPVSAGSCGLRGGAAGCAETAAGASRVSRASVTLSSLDGGSRCGVAGGEKLWCYQRAQRLALDHADDVARLPHAEDHHGHVVVAAEGYGCGVHDAEVQAEDVRVGNLLELGDVGVDFGVGGIDAVDRGGLQQDVGFDLHGAQRGSGVGGEEGVAGAGGEDDDAALLQMAHGAAADVGLGDLVDLDGGHDAADDPELLDGVLQGDRIDHGGQHAHVVGRDAVHVDGLLGDAAKEVSASDDDADLAAECVDGGQFGGYFVNEDGVDAEARACGQGFSGKLEEDSLVHVRSKYRMGLGEVVRLQAAGCQLRRLDGKDPALKPGLCFDRYHDSEGGKPQPTIGRGDLFLAGCVPDEHVVRTRDCDVVAAGLDVHDHELACRLGRSHGDDRLTRQNRVKPVEQRRERSGSEHAVIKGCAAGVGCELREVLLALERAALVPVGVRNNGIQPVEGIRDDAGPLQGLRSSFHVRIQLIAALGLAVVADD